MKNLRLILFLVVALAQIAVPASMIWKRQQTLREGKLWKFRTAPVDPVDAMRGRYLSLRFEAEEFPYTGSMPFGRDSYATLKEAADGFAVIEEVGGLPGENTVRVENYGVYEGKARVRFPFNEFWVNEANAPAAERAYFSHSTRERREAYVTVRIRGDDAAIEELYLAGQPLREYLKANPEP